MLKLLKADPQPMPPPAIDDEAEEFRNQLVLVAQAITRITDTKTNLAARNAAVTIRDHLKQVEAERVRLTKPLLTGQRLLKSLSDDHVAPLEAELSRLERLAADWLLAEQRRVEREKAAQDAELTRLMQERLALEARAARAASELTSEADLARAIEIEARAKEAALAVQTQAAEPLARVDKARGQSLKEVMCYEITDIVALWKAKKDCVKLVPSAAMIQELCVPGDGTPGIRTWFESRSTYSTR